MTRLGTWDTFDVPTKNEDKAFEFLYDEFEKIGGHVRKVQNPHDFGFYPSFEIDMPDNVLEIKDNEDDLIEESENGDETATDQLNILDEWMDSANEIYGSYSKAFQEWL